MKSSLLTALTYTVIPVAAAIAGTAMSAIQPPKPSLKVSLRRFGAGAGIAVVAIELLPDLLHTHALEGIGAFTLGIALMVGLNWVARRYGMGREDEVRRPTATILWAAANLLITGLVIGGGFVAGIGDGRLLTLALSIETLSLSWSASSSQGLAGAARGKVMATALLLVLATALGVVAGAMLLGGRTGVDLDPVFSFGLAAIFFRAIESIAVTEEDAGPWTLLMVFAGVVVFFVLARQLGGKHLINPRW